ncbi:MAG: flagellar basal body rod protein FlgF [Kangiellaceae bacterium]|nr:flagellar basal body rod protein FlgF [Kangiellaceae bacterium]
MDKLLYIAMTGARETGLAQAKTANNLANASTTAFKADFAQFRAMPVYGDGHASRVFAMTERPGYRLSGGGEVTTGRDLDVSIRGQGWMVTQNEEGEELLTRRGDLKIDANGTLTDGIGNVIFGDGGPISIPPFEKIDIAADGTISIRPVGAQPNETAIVERIRLVNPDPKDLFKTTEGLFKSSDTEIFDNDIGVSLQTGMLEGSNVSVVEELSNMIAMSRKYEVQVKMMASVEERGQALDRLLQP